MNEIKFRSPRPDEPGHLRRIRRSMELDEIGKSDNQTPQYIDDLVDFLIQYVDEPKDRKEAREALLDLSSLQYEQLLLVVRGGGKMEVPPPSRET